MFSTDCACDLPRPPAVTEPSDSAVPAVTVSCVFPVLLLTAQPKSQYQEDVDQAVSVAGRSASLWGEDATATRGLLYSAEAHEAA